MATHIHCQQSPIHRRLGTNSDANPEHHNCVKTYMCDANAKPDGLPLTKRQLKK